MKIIITIIIWTNSRNQRNDEWLDCWGRPNMSAKLANMYDEW